MRLDQDPALSSFGIHQPGAAPAPVTQRQRLIDEVSAVVAVDGSHPLQPRPGSLATIHRKLDAVCGNGSRGLRIAAWTGWICAVGAGALAWQFARTQNGDFNKPAGHTTQTDHTPPPVSADSSMNRTTSIGTDDSSARQLRVNQEIDTLRQQLKLLGERDAERMTITPGVSWPVIMKMTQPGTRSQISAVDLMLASIMGHAEDEDVNSGPVTDLLVAPAPADADAGQEPVAIPIYDPARDKGQLILSNLPPPLADEAYHLWVKNDETAEPTLVGTLPAEVDPVSTTMDFRLGSTGVVPDTFWITRDARRSPQAPSPDNIVLQGPEMQ